MEKPAPKMCLFSRHLSKGMIPTLLDAPTKAPSPCGSFVVRQSPEVDRNMSMTCAKFKDLAAETCET